MTEYRVIMKLDHQQDQSTLLSLPDELISIIIAKASSSDFQDFANIRSTCPRLLGLSNSSSMLQNYHGDWNVLRQIINAQFYYLTRFDQYSQGLYQFFTMSLKYHGLDTLDIASRHGDLRAAYILLVLEFCIFGDITQCIEQSLCKPIKEESIRVLYREIVLEDISKLYLQHMSLSPDQYFYRHQENPNCHNCVWTKEERLLTERLRYSQTS